MSRGEAEREGERIPSSLCAASTELNLGFDLRNHEIMTRAKTKSRTLN